MPDLFDVPWVVAGGKIGETGYCMRCGEGFSAAMPISITGLTKSIEAFVKKHAHCPEGRASEPEIKAPGDWIASRWTGISSATIWSVMTGMLYRGIESSRLSGFCAVLPRTLSSWLAQSRRGSRSAKPRKRVRDLCSAERGPLSLKISAFRISRLLFRDSTLNGQRW